MRGTLLLCCLALLASACDDGPCGQEANTLRGSIQELYPDLEVDRVRARQVDPETVTVEFFHGNDIVTKVVADVRGFAKGAEIQLSDGDVRRITSPPKDFPTELERGTITFESELAVGEEVIGCFDVLFHAEDDTQRSLSGSFEATLEGGL